jgi:hypothetical protein
MLLPLGSQAEAFMNRALKGFVPGAAMLVAACSTPPAAPSPTQNPSPLGTHTVSWSVGDECTAVPRTARERTYSALVSNGLVTLTNGTFLAGSICTDTTGLGCNQFRLTQDGDNVSVVVESIDWHGGQIVERIEDGTWVEVSAKGAGRQEGSTIRATLEGSLWYCPTPSLSPFPCNAFRSCKTSNLQMTIVPKEP